MTWSCVSVWNSGSASIFREIAAVSIDLCMGTMARPGFSCTMQTFKCKNMHLHILYDPVEEEPENTAAELQISRFDDGRQGLVLPPVRNSLRDGFERSLD